MILKYVKYLFDAVNVWNSFKQLKKKGFINKDYTLKECYKANKKNKEDSKRKEKDYEEKL